jgi:hypothetical protein
LRKSGCYRCGTVKSDIWAGDANRFAREAIQQVNSGVEPFYPVASWHRGMKQLGVDAIVDGAKSVLTFTILQRGVWAGHPQDDPTGGKERVGGGVVEFMTIVTLDDFDGAAKLHGKQRQKIGQGRKSVRFHTQRKSPHKMKRSSRITK